tara:strand:- start:2858 stop:3136 length:279 start_codon:yes stop_codon:yes gene_type:complete
MDSLPSSVSAASYSVVFSLYEEDPDVPSYPEVVISSEEKAYQLARFLSQHTGHRLSRALLGAGLEDDFDIPGDGFVGPSFDVRLTRVEVLRF